MRIHTCRDGWVSGATPPRPRVVLAVVALVVGTVLGGATPARSAPSSAVATVAGGPGQGPATGVAQRPSDVLVAGGRLYVVDSSWHVVRAVELSTGVETVVAGTGVRGLTGNGGPATAAKLFDPWSIARDGSGNLYISETCRVRKVDTAGVITAFAGRFEACLRPGANPGDGGPATAAPVGHQTGLGFGAGSLYIADAENYRVRKVDAAGIITTVAGTGTQGGSGDGELATKAKLGAPKDVAVDSAGNLYIADGDRVRRVAATTGVITTVAGGFFELEDITLAGDAVLYASDPGQGGLYGTGRVYRVDLSTTPASVTTVAGGGIARDYVGDGGPATQAELARPLGVAVDGAGHLYIADQFQSRVRRVHATTAIITTMAGHGGSTYGGEGVPGPWAQLGELLPGLVVDAAGNAYVSDREHHRVRKLDAVTGEITTVAGSSRNVGHLTEGGYSGDGGLATAAKLDYPGGLAIDETGLYVADTGNCRVRRIDGGGNISTFVGGDCDSGNRTALIAPLSLALDGSGNLYIGDLCQVRKADRQGTLTTVAGSDLTCGYTGDGGPAVLANLEATISALAVDRAGNLYLSDTGNCVVRKVDTLGLITTVAGRGPGRCGYSGDGGPAISAEVSPDGLSVDGAGNLYIGAGTIRRVDAATGVITSAFAPSQLRGTALALAGNTLYASDAVGVYPRYGRVRKAALPPPPSPSAEPGTTTRVSVDSSGLQAQGAQGSDLGTSVFPATTALSRDGRYVAFASTAVNLVPGDTNGVADVFVRDHVAGTTTRVSGSSAGAQGNRASGHPSISADGRYVAFRSEASNLVDGDTNGVDDVFVHDRATGTTTRVSVDSAGNAANGPSHDPSISADGQVVAYASGATNLVAGDTNGVDDVFVRDIAAGTTTRVSVDSAGRQANDVEGGGSRDAAISGNGKVVAFTSRATNLVPNDTNFAEDVFVHDRASRATTRVSVTGTGAQAEEGHSFDPAVNDDGSAVAFVSEAINLAGPDDNEAPDVFVRNRAAGTTALASADSAGNRASAAEFSLSVSPPSISGDGRFVAFASNADNLASGNYTFRNSDIYVRDTHRRTTGRSSIGAAPEAQAHGHSGLPAISADGRVVSFVSAASNLVANDTNGAPDVFVRTRPVSDFSLSASPQSRSVPRGNSTTYTVMIAGADGFADPVKLSVSGLPAATSASFSPNPATDSSTLTITTTRKTTLGTFTLTVGGTGGGLTRTTTVTLTVTRR